MSASVDLSYPFEGLWLVQNSPANRVPSHGTSVFATSHAIDFVPVTDNGRTAPITLTSLVQPQPADLFPGFGRPILSPAAGRVWAVSDGEPDHPAYRGFPSIRYALTQGRRATTGWSALAGNHVLIDSNGIFIALCHLLRGSITVRPGQDVSVGDQLARCGNSGNSTEPHTHVQAMDAPDAGQARPVPMTFHGVLPRNGVIVRGGEEAA